MQERPAEDEQTVGRTRQQNGHARGRHHRRSGSKVCYSKAFPGEVSDDMVSRRNMTSKGAQRRIRRHRHYRYIRIFSGF